MFIEPEDVLACRINAHRHCWNGVICSNPLNWNCGTVGNFRENVCDNGNPRCNHLHIFDATSPRFITPDLTLIQLVSERPELLAEQLLFFFGPRFNGTSGIIPGVHDEVLYGAYRIKRCFLDGTASWSTQIVIEPYPEDWVIFPQNQVRRPYTQAIDGINYFKAMNVVGAIDAVREVVRIARPDNVWTQAHQQRLERFATSIERWLLNAQKHLQDQPPYEPQSQQPKSYKFGKEGFDSPFAKLKGMTFRSSPPASDGAVEAEGAGMVDSRAASTLTEWAGDEDLHTDALEAAVGLAATTFDVESEETSADTTAYDRYVLPEESQIEQIADVYGERMIKALHIASLSKSLIILTGPPGVGKSWLSRRLIHDPQRQRSLLVPVSSTWRGREDLLGYVNPVTGNFVPTAFTRFLIRAEEAWHRGDRQVWLAVFEEFNLSQPEHWLSDFLVRLEYEPDACDDRSIDLGASLATETKGNPPRSSIYLPPNLKFVATINNDHTVRPLSTRILDRAALLEISASGKEALKRAGLDLGPKVEEIVQDLNFRLLSHGVAFSLRSAHSLLRTTEALDSVNPMDALDHVLVQGVLSKLRLHAGDPGDELLLNRLQDWISRPICAHLVLCMERIASWDDARCEGRDVLQA